MKKKIVFLALAFAALLNVSCQKEAPIEAPAAVVEQSNDNIEVIIKNGAPFQTKSSGDFVTVTCIKKSDKVTLVSETTQLANGIVESKNYTENGELIATLYFEGNKIIDIELAEYVTGIDTKALEKFRDCVKRVYRDLKDNLEENCTILVDMGISSTVGELVAEATAVAKCI